MRPNIKMQIDEDTESIETYFDNQEDMKVYCSQIAGERCIKYKVRNNGNYYKIFCNEADCPFQIIYNQRDSKNFMRGYYLISDKTSLFHKDNCPNSIKNLNDTKDPKTIAKQILPLFTERFPSLCEIKNAIQCFNGNEFSKSELKYIKKLAKLQFFKDATTTISQLVEYCQNLVKTHNWKFDIEFQEGMVSSLILFPPWAEHLLKFYHDPLIVDATFTIENLRFISGVIVDGEWNTQTFGLVIRGTEDTQSYSFLFNFVSNVIGEEHITIIADMAKCIRKAAKECLPHHSFVFCYFHLKQNFLKKFQFTPSDKLWNILQMYIKGEISYELLQKEWIDEETKVNEDARGFLYLSEISKYFSPTPKTHKRGIISSQRIENLNGKMKKNGNSAFEMLRQFVHLSTKWFEKGAAISYSPDQLLTNYADDILNCVIQSEFKNAHFDENLHFKLNNTECGCNLGHDLGIPCPFSIRLLRINQINCNDPLDTSLFQDLDLLHLISPEWLTSTHRKAFEPLIERKNPTFQVLPLDVINDGFSSQNLDVISAKIRWLYQNSQKYKTRVDELLKDAQDEIIFPFFNIKKPKETEKKRHLSSIEVNLNQKKQDEKMNIISKHLDGNKITKASLYGLAEHLMQTLIGLPKIYKSSSKKDLCDWFRLNWELISPTLAIQNSEKNEMSEIEDSFFMENDSDI